MKEARRDRRFQKIYESLKISQNAEGKTVDLVFDKRSSIYYDDAMGIQVPAGNAAAEHRNRGENPRRTRRRDGGA